MLFWSSKIKENKKKFYEWHRIGIESDIETGFQNPDE